MLDETQCTAQSAVRVDLHCHSSASSEPGEAVLEALGCPESYSDPADVYAQARRRGMDFVTITDHDSIQGVAKLVHHSDVIVGEELTCFFPEDGCKMHVLLWGIDEVHHAAVQSMANDIYRVAEYIESHQIAHAVAHPVYRQNDKLELWHLQRLLLMFKGFECLNGAHSILHRRAFEPMLDDLTRDSLTALAQKHGMTPRWPEPWVKTRTGGSDDHGLFNIGRTWTEFPPHVRTTEEMLACLREGRCRPGGEAGSSLKLAHNFYGVGIRYFTQRLSRKPAGKPVLQALVGDRRLRRRDVARAVIGNSVRGIGRRILRPLQRKASPSAGTALLEQLFQSSLKNRLPLHRRLVDALSAGQAPLAEHEAMFALINDLVRDTTGGILQSTIASTTRGSLSPVFESLAAVACQQFMLMPYYFAMFHQNRERHLLPRMTGHGRSLGAAGPSIGVFIDSVGNADEIGRMAGALAEEAQSRGHPYIIHGCEESASRSHRHRNFAPLASIDLPGMPGMNLRIPPLIEILEWADRQQFDAIHIHTPGPMGLCGAMAAAMLRIPVIATHSIDLPGDVFDQTADHRLTCAATGYLRWLYGRCDALVAPSRHAQRSLRTLGFEQHPVATLPPAAVTDRPVLAQAPQIKSSDGRTVVEPYRLVCVMDMPYEKRLEMVIEAFRALCNRRHNVALVIATRTPSTASLKKKLAKRPIYFVEINNREILSALYGSADLALFPWPKTALAQDVLDAQAAGVPVLVADDGAAQEVMDDDVTGLVLPAKDSPAWTSAIDALLTDVTRRLRMARTAPHRTERYSMSRCFDACWDIYAKAIQTSAAKHGACEPAPTPVVDEPSRLADAGASA